MRTTMLISLVLATLLGGVVAGAAAQTAGDAPAPLSAQRADALHPVIDYAQILDATKPAPARLSRYTSACRKLPRTDRLIVAFRGVCRSEGDAFTAWLRLPNCRSADRCRARLTRYAAALGRQADASRRLNTVLKQTVPDVDCRGALRVGLPVLRTVGRLTVAAAGLAKAIGRETATQINTRVARLYGTDRSALLDHRGRLDLFRAVCR